MYDLTIELLVSMPSLDICNPIRSPLIEFSCMSKPSPIFARVPLGDAGSIVDLVADNEPAVSLTIAPSNFLMGNLCLVIRIATMVPLARKQSYHYNIGVLAIPYPGLSGRASK